MNNDISVSCLLTFQFLIDKIKSSVYIGKLKPRKLAFDFFWLFLADLNYT